MDITDTDEAGEWVNNETLDSLICLLLLRLHASLHWNREDNSSEVEVFAIFDLPIWLAFMAQLEILDAKGIVFKVPARRPNQNRIIFERVKSRFSQSLDSECNY